MTTAPAPADRPGGPTPGGASVAARRARRRHPVRAALTAGHTLVGVELGRLREAQHAPADGLCAGVGAHLRATEALLHPVLRDLGADAGVIEHAEALHEVLQGQVERLATMAADDPMFDARIAALGDVFGLLARFETGQLAPLAADPRIEGGALARAIRRHRDEALACDGASADVTPWRAENEDADPVGDPPR